MVSEDRDLLLEKASMNNVLDVLEREASPWYPMVRRGWTAGMPVNYCAMYTFDRQERKILLCARISRQSTWSSAGRRSASATRSFMQGIDSLQVCITARQ